MKECAFESDVLDALASRRWPARADETLRAHVASCESCADLADAAGALLAEHELAYDEARLPTAGAVWQRAQIRAREDATRTATRPIGFVQGVAFTFAVAAVLGVAAWVLPYAAGLGPYLSGALAALPRPSLSLPSIDLDVVALLSNTAVQLAVGAWLLLTPVAVYFASRD